MNREKRGREQGGGYETAGFKPKHVLNISVSFSRTTASSGRVSAIRVIGDANGEVRVEMVASVAMAPTLEKVGSKVSGVSRRISPGPTGCDLCYTVSECP